RWSRGAAWAGLTLSFSVLLLPALSGQHDLLLRFRWPLVALAVALVTSGCWLLLRWLDLRPEVTPSFVGNARVRRIVLRATSGVGFAIWLWATEPLRLYPALLLFLFSGSTLLLAASFDSRRLGANPSLRARAAGGATLLGIVLALVSSLWVAEAQGFARVRYVFSRRCAGADALVRLDESLQGEWLKARS